MNTSLYTVGELVVSTGVSTAVCSSVSAEPLLTALITFGVSIVTIVGGELIKFAVAFIQSKTKKYKDEKETKEDK